MANKDRFIKIYGKGSMTKNEIWLDTETGVNYLYHVATGGYNGGITPLLGKDGKPVVYTEDEILRATKGSSD